MGITRNCARFLTFAKSRNVSFERTVMLGRQVLYVTPQETKALFDYFKLTPIPVNAYSQFAESLFHSLGASVIDSIDYSDFEGASIITDMNEAIPANLKEQYSVVFDGGTLEHVFNFPQAIKNCMDMLKIGGHFIAITPANNQCGHGFYQFSPELFFSIFNPENGFELQQIIIGVDLPEKGIRDWYRVKEPAKVKRRVTLTNSQPTYLMVLARKIRSTNELALKPMQSDYQNVWEVHNSIKNSNPIETETYWIFLYRKYVPEVIKSIIRKLRNQSSDKQELIKELGLVNPAFFEKLEV